MFIVSSLFPIVDVLKIHLIEVWNVTTAYTYHYLTSVQNLKNMEIFKLIPLIITDWY